MAAGDTIAGQIRYIRSSEHGEEILVNPLSSFQLDRKAEPEKALFFNKSDPKVLQLIQPHLDSPGITPRMSELHAGETLKVEHKSAALAEAVDYDADEVFINVVQVDHNYGRGDPRRAQVRQLSANDTELSANPTSSTSGWVTFFEATVPNRKTWFLGGPQMVAAVENA